MLVSLSVMLNLTVTLSFRVPDLSIINLPFPLCNV